MPNGDYSNEINRMYHGERRRRREMEALQNRYGASKNNVPQMRLLPHEGG